MTFQTAAFLFFFFPLAVPLYLLTPGTRKRNLFFILAGLVFYAWGQWEGLPCLLLSALLSWGAGRLLPRVRRRRTLLAAVLGLHLLLLGSLKYWNFFAVTVNGSLGLGVPASTLPLPVGLSFFTFKAMSYEIDVYRDEKTGARRFSDLLLYLSFFPQVTSGPIARFGQFASQLEDRPVSAEGMARGLRRFIVGFGKKALIAGMAAPVADSAFSLGAGLDWRMAWLGAAAYTLQIYFDFSGYSDMAIGLGEMFGFVTPENFNYPYIPASVTEFWRRWHISLSSWFRDYLYFPLGGGRRGKVRKCTNKALVFLLCGLWHGASWTFVLWGAWHGLFSALESALDVGSGKKPVSLGRKVLGHGYTLLVVCLGFILFRAASAGEAAAFFRALIRFAPAPASTLALERVSPAAWLAMGAGVLGSLPVVPWLKRRCGSGPWRALSYLGAAALFLLCLLATAGSGFQPFIYNQF